MLEDIRSWHRVGRGRNLQFFATDEELREWVTNGLPDQYRPYHLVGYDQIKEGKKYVQVPFRCELDELLASFEGPSGRRVSVYLWSEALSPDLVLRRGDWLSAVLSYHGLISIQHGRIHGERIEASSIGLVDRVENDRTGEVLEHGEYLAIFKHLKRLIEKSLCYATIITFPDGSETESTLQRMTAKAAEAYRQGVPYSHRPGRLLKPGKSAGK